MLDEQKIDDIFSQFVRFGSGSDDIRQIYETLPFLDHDQQRVLTLLNMLAVKHNSSVLREMADKITAYAKHNRKTGLRFTRLVEAFSLYKHFKGYKMSGNVGSDQQQ